MAYFQQGAGIIILVHINTMASGSCCRFVGCTPMMQIYWSTTSKRCSIGLRSVVCGSCWSTVNSLSCLRNQFEIIWVLGHGALSRFCHLDSDPSTWIRDSSDQATFSQSSTVPCWWACVNLSFIFFFSADGSVPGARSWAVFRHAVVIIWMLCEMICEMIWSLRPNFRIWLFIASVWLSVTGQWLDMAVALCVLIPL